MRLGRRMFWVAAFCAALSGAVSAAAEPGRLLYTVDDDWDWASPLGAEQPSRLSRYGEMPWSALDWAEQGLAEVRGVLLGSPPDVGDYLTMEELTELRGEKKSYSKQAYEAGSVAPLLAGPEPPNLIILMQDQGKFGKPSPDDIESLTGFLKAGGRLVVLDDWRHCDGLMETLLGEARETLGRAAAPPEPADDATDEGDLELRATVERLLAELADDDFLVREAAAAALIKLGEPILPLIEAPEGLAPDTRARLAQIRATINPELKPVVPVPGVNPREARHQERVKHMTDMAAELEAAGVPHQVEEVYVNKNGDPLPALRLIFAEP